MNAVTRTWSLRLFLLVATGLNAFSTSAPSGESDQRLWAEDLNEGTVADKDSAVVVNNRPVHVAFDTGTNLGLLLFEPSAIRLGLKMSVAPPELGHVPGRVKVGVTDPYDVSYFGQITEGTVLPVARLPHEVTMFLNEELDGVIGWTEMRQSIWFLQLADGNFSQYPEVPDDVIEKWIRLPISERNGTLSFVLPGDARGVQRVIVDTGNSGGILLPPDQWKEWTEKNPKAPPTLETNYLAGQGIRYSPESWAAAFSLGSLDLKDVAMGLADPTYYEVQAAPGEKIVAIGLAALARMEIFIDGPNHVAYARASSSAAPAYFHNRMGVVFVPRDEKSNDLIAHVVEKGPAFEAGIRDGDLLLKVNGQAIAEWRTRAEQARSMTGRVPPGTQKHYTLQRGEQVIELDVTARNILGPIPTTTARIQTLSVPL